MKTEQSKTNNKCGLVMPISSIDGCSEQHWLEVKEIISSSVSSAGFEPNLVSYADDVGIIQKRIIQNLYDNPIVVCDVSGKNPNVMFELGIRLAFDKPTIIVKDDQTSYSFDTSPIEHIEYPRDLRFSKIVGFKEALAEKIKATVERSNKDPSYTTFLKHFGTFTAAKLDSKEVSKEDYIIEEVRELRKIVERQERIYNRISLNANTHRVNIDDDYSFLISGSGNPIRKFIYKPNIDFNEIMKDPDKKAKMIDSLLQSIPKCSELNNRETIEKLLNDWEFQQSKAANK